MRIIRRCASHGGACVGVKTHHRSLFLPGKRKKRVHAFLYAHTPLCVGIFWYLKLNKAENICSRHVGVCSLGHP